MSLRTRFALVLGLLLAALVVALGFLRGMERKAVEQSLADERVNRELLLNHWLDLSSRSLPQFVADYAQGKLWARSARELTTPEVRVKIAGDLRQAGLHSLWALDAAGETRLHVAAAQPDTLEALPIATADLLSLVAHTPSPRFFAEASRAIFEICVERLPPPADPSTRNEAPAWLVVTRAFDQAQLEKLGALSGSTVSLAAPSATVPVSDDPTAIVLLRPLRDWQDHPLRSLRVEYHAPELGHMEHSAIWQTGVFVTFGVLLLVAMWLAVQAWVLRPLGLVSTSLAHGDAAPIRPLQAESSELGSVAQLVATSFAQREQLQREIAERAQAQAALEKSELALRRTIDERTKLGRDLHDGVIQSLYAAGMGLAGVRAQLSAEQAEALARLEQTREMLNATIHDLRNFISGMEPEALKLQSFTHAVTAMLEVVQGLRPLEAKIAIDEELAAQLTLPQRVHALQIAREAVSNAIRHGDARRVEIFLRRSGDNVEFEIVDNGRGFDSASPFSTGRGLKNLADRAHELGGEVKVSSVPREGTRVRLVFGIS